MEFFKKIIFAAFLSLPILAFADGKVIGRVLEKATQAPIEFATVRIEKAANGDFVAGATTDGNGRFSISVPDGKYIVKIESVGAVPQTREANIKGGNADFGPISLAEDAQLLKEVVVEGIRGQMKFELDRKVFSVDANISAAGLSASELLEAIPSVEVDQDGAVSLRGNSSVTIWINGKDSGLTADNQGQILEQIPAESIDKVEVITNPSAKYSPEGTAGIINIVLKKDRHAGYFGSAEIGGNTRGGANANGNINYNFGKWEGFAGVGLRMRHNTGGSHSWRDYDSGHFLYSDGESGNHGKNAFLRLGLACHITDNDQVYLNGFGMLGHRRSSNDTHYRSDLPDQWTSNINEQRNRGNNRGGHAELGYKHNWSDTHLLDVLCGVNYWGGPNSNFYTQRRAWPDTGLQEIFQRQDMDICNKSMEVKVDYTNQVAPWLKVEAGFNGRYNRENSPVTTYQGTNPQELTLLPQLYNRFIYDNDINAIYGTLGGKWDKLSFSAGLRAEAWQVRTRSLEFGQSAADVPQYKKNNFALFPSAFISYSLPKDNEVQINYTRRIRRPWGGQLNSFRDIANPTNISYGNPELAPQYSNAFELNYLKSWTFHMISFSAYLRTTEDDMNRISYLDNDVLYTTWANVGTHTNTGCEIVLKNQFFKRLDVTTTVNLYNSHMPAWSLQFVNGGKVFDVSGKQQDSFSWDARCMASVRLPWDMSFQATGRYRSRSITAQGSREPGWSVDAGLRKNIGNWSVSLNCRDIFDSRKWHSVTYGAGYRQESESWHGGRRLQLSIKYAFGNMAPPKRPDRDGGMDASDSPMGGGYSEME